MLTAATATPRPVARWGHGNGGDAAAGNGGVADSEANGGTIAIGDVNSGGNQGNTIIVGN